MSGSIVATAVAARPLAPPPALASGPGVAEVARTGGAPREGARPWWGLRVQADPAAWCAPRLRSALLAASEDVAVLAGPLSASPPGLLLTDVDSTLVEQEVIDELAARAGRRAQVAAITSRAMRGEIGFKDSLRLRVRQLAGLEEAALGAVAAQLTPSPGARALIAWAHAHGCRVGAVSGGFEQILEPLAAELHLDHHAANVLDVRGGRLTGRVRGAVVGPREKVARLREWARADGVDLALTAAIGDGANDIPVLRIAGLGIGYRPKPAVRQAAGATIGFPRLDAAIGLLGGGERLR